MKEQKMGVETERRGIRGRVIRLVMRTSNSERERRDEDDDSGMEYKRVEFHMVEVSTESNSLSLQLRRDVLPPLLCRSAEGMMLSLDPSSISVFGGLSPSIGESLVSLKPPPERRHLYYKGAATINLRRKEDQWKPFPLQSRPYNAFLPVCAVLGGKLYNFGCVYLAPEVFDPSLGYWKRFRLPSNVTCTKPSYPVVADPSYNRILIRFRCHSRLYAFYPEAEAEAVEEEKVSNDPDHVPCVGRCELVNKPGVDCFPWATMVAVVDELLFLYEFNMFLVYDLSPAGRGDRLDVVWSSSMCGNVMVTCMEFTSLFSLDNDNGLLCFTYSFSLPDNSSTIKFLIFKPYRCFDSTSIILTPISFHSRTIESTDDVIDFLPLSQEASEIIVGKLA